MGGEINTFYVYWRTILKDQASLTRTRKLELLKKFKKGELESAWELAKLCKKTGDIKSAKELYIYLIQISGRHRKSSYVNLGSIEYSLGNTELAQEHFFSASNLGSVIAKWNLGFSYEQEGNFGVAIAWFKQAADLGHIQAKKRYAKLASRPSEKYLRSPREAEHNARDWAFYWGHHDAKVTKTSGDAGIDVMSSRIAIQVKYEQSKTGRPALQSFYGATYPIGKKAIFFSFAGYSKHAIEYADSVDMALFRYNELGVPTAMNSTAKNFISNY